MKKRNLLFNLFPPYLIILIVAVLTQLWLANGALTDFYFNEKKSELEARTIIVEKFISRIDIEDTALLTDIITELGKSSLTRITIIDSDGNVIADSHKDPAAMDNHSDRPEVISAINFDKGTSTRYSFTLGQEMMYTASYVEISGKPLIIRTALSVDALHGTLLGLRKKLLYSSMFILSLTVVVSYFVSKRIIRPLETMKAGVEKFSRGDLTHKLEAGNILEISSLAESMNEMARQLDRKIRTIRKQQNELEAILSSMTEGVVAIDSDERVISINPAASGFFHVDREFAIGKTIHETIRNSELVGIIRKVVKNGSVSDFVISSMQSGNRWFQVTGTTLKNADGKNMGAVMVINDITQIRHLENVRKEFVANVSHELKTPVTSIKGFVETLQDGAVNNPEDTKQFLKIIQKQADRLNAIIDDLLELSRLEQEETISQIPREKVNVSRIISEAVSDCRKQADDNKITVVHRCDDDLEFIVNPPLIRQALVNLLNNAIKYSEIGTEVKISCRREGEWISISVSDHGPGIPRNHQDRIFERFYRVDKARSRNLGGTGLGLAIVKHIMRIHNGDVSVQSGTGSGSTFTISLPENAQF